MTQGLKTESAAGALSLQGLVKRYADAVAVNGLDLEIASGEFFSLLGASGCGKTTTLRMLAGFEYPDEGEILLDGRSIIDIAPNKRPVNTVFQSYALFPFMSVEDNVAFGLKYQKTSKQETRRRVAEAIELVEMSRYATRRPAQLSGGQQQRVALARALVLEPTVLLLDEPLGALDAKLRRQLQVDLRALQKRIGTTFVYVTHDQEEALTMSDRLAILVDGKVEQQGTPSEIYANPASAYVAGFLGSANLYQGKVTETAAQLVTTEIEGLPLVAHATRTVTLGEEVTLVLRPERVELSPIEGICADAEANVFPSRIEHLVFRGGHTHVITRAAGCRLTAEVANVHGELPAWLVEGQEVCTRVSHRAAQLLPESAVGSAEAIADLATPEGATAS